MAAAAACTTAATSEMPSPPNARPQLQLTLSSGSQEQEAGVSSDGLSVKSPLGRIGRQAVVKEARRTARVGRAGRSADWTRQRNQKQLDRARGRGRDYKVEQLGHIPEGSAQEMNSPEGAQGANNVRQSHPPAPRQDGGAADTRPAGRGRRRKAKRAARSQWASDSGTTEDAAGSSTAPISTAESTPPLPARRAVSMYPIIAGSPPNQEEERTHASHDRMRAASCSNLDNMMPPASNEAARSSLARSAEVIVLRDNLLKLLQKALEKNLTKLVEKASDLEGRLEMEMQQLNSYADAEARLEKLGEFTTQAQNILRRHYGRRDEAESMLLPKLVECMSMFSTDLVDLVSRQRRQQGLDSQMSIITETLKHVAELYRWINKHFPSESNDKRWVHQLDEAATILCDTMIRLTGQHQKHAMDCWSALQRTGSNGMAQLPAEVQRAWKNCVDMQNLILSPWPRHSKVYRLGLGKLCGLFVAAADIACTLLSKQDTSLKAAGSTDDFVSRCEKTADGMSKAMNLLQHLFQYCKIVLEMLRSGRSDDDTWADSKRDWVNQMRESFFRVVFAVTACSCSMYPSDLNVLRHLQLDKLQQQATRALMFVMEWDLCRELNLGNSVTDTPADQTLAKLSQLMEVTTKLLHHYEDARTLLEQKTTAVFQPRQPAAGHHTMKPLFAELRATLYNPNGTPRDTTTHPTSSTSLSSCETPVASNGSVFAQPAQQSPQASPFISMGLDLSNRGVKIQPYPGAEANGSVSAGGDHHGVEGCWNGLPPGVCGTPGMNGLPSAFMCGTPAGMTGMPSAFACGTPIGVGVFQPGASGTALDVTGVQAGMGQLHLDDKDAEAMCLFDEMEESLSQPMDAPMGGNGESERGYVLGANGSGPSGLPVEERGMPRDGPMATGRGDHGSVKGASGPPFAGNGADLRPSTLHGSPGGGYHGPFAGSAPRRIQSDTLDDPFWAVHWDEVMEGAQRLGSGGFGEVHRARYCHAEVAVKVLTVAPSDLERVAQEVDILRNLARHPHIVRFLGACKKHGVKRRLPGSNSEVEQDQLAIVMEFCNLGSLHSVINKKHDRADHERVKQFFTDYWLRLEVARGVAAGLAYMHRQNPKVVHRDLTSSNVLLQFGHPWVAKVSDFGLSRTKDANKSALYASGEMCSPAYRAPELLKEGERYTEKADVYSFGVILWEIITLQQPWQEQLHEEMENTNRLHKDFEQRLFIAGKVCEGHNLEFEQAKKKLAGKGFELSTVSQIEKLAKKCWRMDPKKRPCMDDVAAELGDIISKYVRLTRRTDVPHMVLPPRQGHASLSIANFLRG